MNARARHLGPRASAPRALAARGRAVLVGLVGVAFVAAACGDGEVTRPPDRTAPTVNIVRPEEDEVVGQRPGFVIEVSDAISGIVCLSVRATINGRDYTQFFRTRCDAEAGEIRVLASEITPAIPEGGARLSFTISDNAGNQAMASRSFTVTATLPPPPPPPP